MKCGIGIRPELFESVFEQKPAFGFLEAHSENYFGESIARTKLLELREHYPLSLHGVGLSLGRADDLNKKHLSELRALVNDVQPLFVSEHLAWSAYAHRHVPDLLPLPLTDTALDAMCDHIDQMQNALGRQIFVENPSNYLLFDQLQIPEPEFLNTLSAKTGCGLLVDVNNIHVSAANIGRDGKAYIDDLNSDSIGQFHLAGYTEVTRDVAGVTETVLIDTHNQTVFDPVWSLYEHALKRHGGRPTLFEWDSDFPEFDTLLSECEKANVRLDSVESKQIKVAPVLFKKEPDKSSLLDGQADFLDKLFNLKKALPTAIDEHQHRIWIYQNNVFAACQDYLSEVYPATVGVVGADFFKQMAQKFIQDTPPSDGNIHLYGDKLHRQIKTFKALRKMPYLLPLMKFEWALHTAYYSKVSDVLDQNEIAQDVLLTMPVEFNSSVEFIKTKYPVFEIHRQSLPDYDGEIAIDLTQGGETLLVYKRDYAVNHRVLGKDELRFFNEIKKSSNLMQAIESLTGSIEMQALSSALVFIFENKLLKAK